MFIKPIKVKSNVQLKGSETKKLKARLQNAFQDLSDENVSLLIPNKATVTHIKAITHSGTITNIYSVDKRPMFFEDENNSIIPSLYTLWAISDMLPYFTTHPAVLPKLGNGADLMLPGVIRRECGMNAFGHYKKDQIVAVNLTSNKAAVAVGRLARSSNDLYMSGGHGICVKVLHVFGDKLWGIEPLIVKQIPDLEAVVTIPKNEEFPELGSTTKKFVSELGSSTKKSENIVELIPNSEYTKDLDKKLDVEIPIDNMHIENSNENDEKIFEEAIKVEEHMDEILRSAFLTALKFDRKNFSLPLLTSNFYRLHVIPAATKQIDLKQTTYKKFSKFLNEMSEKGLIVVREEAKGIEKIISVDFDHPDIINFIPSDKTSDDKSENSAAQLFHAEMMELYLVTDETIVLFSKLNYRKGDGISSTDVKKLIKEYVIKNKLTCNTNTRDIKLDQTLADICKVGECSLSELQQNILFKMEHTYEMRAKSETASNKPPIQMSLATRSGNKKVTLVSNLESYGIIIPEFVKACKLGAAASTTIIKAPNPKQMLLQIQGNQIRFIHNLLTGTYKIPSRQIAGLDLAKKEKKKKN